MIWVFIASFLFTGPSGTWNTNFEEAKQEASENNKYILLSFSGSDWCIPCMRMETDIFESDVFREFAEKNLVMVKADFPRQKRNALSPSQAKQNDKLAEKYNPDGIFPYTIIMTPQGKNLVAFEGLYKGNAYTFVQKMEAIIH